ncbi:MAG: hypothetical protein LBD64_06490 [Odoribacteraceae bacterium]|jgi:hypothetical protein|nr:hypothetical protein [Odoribacteraceae bacterium]
MKKQTLPVIIAICVFCAQACIDKDYDFSARDKNAVLYIPPVPVGAVDTAWFKSNLTELPGIYGDFAMEYLVSNLFTEEVAEKFFFDGAGDISLVGNLDMFISGLNESAVITMQLSLTDREGNAIDEIKLADRKVTNKASQEFLLQVASDKAPFMANADGIRIVFVFDGLENVTLDRDDYLVLNQLVLKTGGMHVEF